MPPQTPSVVPGDLLPPLEPDVAAAPAPEGTFTEVAQQIFARLNERKYLLLQRALLAVWPALLTVALAYVFWGGAVDGGENGLEVIVSSVSANPIEGWVFGFALLFSVIYGLIVSAALSIERVIWVDSYFDGKNLAPKESLRVARRLLPSAARVWIWSWLRYWLPVLLVPIVGCAALAFGVYRGGDTLVIGLGALLASLIFAAVWAFFVNVKLRNLWFVFLDHHDGARVETRAIADELDRLNRATKTKDFARYVLSVTGVDTLVGLTKLVTSLAARAGGASNFLNRTAAGQGVKIYAQAVAAQAQSFARVIAAYVFYRAARAHLGLGQAVNERVYALARE